MSKDSMMPLLDEVEQTVAQTTADYSPTLQMEEVGRIRFSGQGIVQAEGLGGVDHLHEGSRAWVELYGTEPGQNDSNRVLELRLAQTSRYANKNRAGQ